MHPTILKTNGKPAFVVLPYDEYVALYGWQTCRKSQNPR